MNAAAAAAAAAAATVDFKNTISMAAHHHHAAAAAGIHHQIQNPFNMYDDVFPYNYNNWNKTTAGIGQKTNNSTASGFLSGHWATNAAASSAINCFNSAATLAAAATIPTGYNNTNNNTTPNYYG